MKIKIITGFDSEQRYTIDEEEAHKAYYLFLNPNARGIFSNGLALVGKNIQAIQPDYNATMGWHPTHKLDTYDWEELREKGIDKKINAMMEKAKEVSYLIKEKPDLLNKKLSEIINLPLNTNTETKRLADKFKV